MFFGGQWEERVRDRVPTAWHSVGGDFVGDGRGVLPRFGLASPPAALRLAGHACSRGVGRVNAKATTSADLNHTQPRAIRIKLRTRFNPPSTSTSVQASRYHSHLKDRLWPESGEIAHHRLSAD